MSQVQIRQVPVATSSETKRIVGSWFPTGYYGHFRAKSRAELCQYFRQLARPEPPQKFIDRQQAEATTHVFSRHDNRFKFESDPLVRGTQTGFGKRKAKTNVRGEFDPLFVSWVPKNVDRKHFVDDVKLSSYAEEFNRDSTAARTLMEVQTKPSTAPASIESATATTTTPSEPDATIYATTYRHGQPDSERSKQIREETYRRYLTTRTRLLQNKRYDRSPSVAACLVWNSIQNEKLNSQASAAAAPAAPPPPPPPPPQADSTIRIAVPMTLQPRPPPTNPNMSPRHRVQSAGPRLTNTVPAASPYPPAAKPFHSASVQNFGTPTVQMQRPHTAATTTSREHYTGANFSLQKEVPPRAVTSFEPKHNNSMDSLIAKYM